MVARLGLVVLLPVLLSTECIHPQLTCVYIGDACETGMTELDWEAGRTVVELHDCVRLPHNYALLSRTCCGELCSDYAQECEASQDCICGRILNFAGGVL